VMVLFTFVVMLLNAGREERTLGSRAAARVGFPAVVVLLAVLATIILRAQGLASAHLGVGLTNDPNGSNLVVLSQVLFHELLLPFELTSVLILIAILGAVAIARAEGSKVDGSERTAPK